MEQAIQVGRVLVKCKELLVLQFYLSRRPLPAQKSLTLCESGLAQFEFTQIRVVTLILQKKGLDLKEELVAFKLYEPLDPREHLRLKLSLHLLLLLRSHSFVQLILSRHHSRLTNEHFLQLGHFNLVRGAVDIRLAGYARLRLFISGHHLRRNHLAQVNVKVMGKVSNQTRWGIHLTVRWHPCLHLLLTF